MKTLYDCFIKERFTGVIYRKTSKESYKDAMKWCSLNKDICEETEDIECFYEIYKNGELLCECHTYERGM